MLQLWPKRVMRLWVMLPALLLLALVGCSSGATPASPEPSPAPTQDLAESGKTFYFDAKTGESFDLYSANLSGADVKQLTEGAGDEIEPDLSPDGARLAYARSETTGGSGLQLHIMDLESGKSEPVFSEPTNAVDFSPMWSPDGAQIAFQRISKDGQSGVFIVNSDGSKVRQVAQTRGRDARPTWTPDGKSLIFTASISGKAYKLYKINVEGTESNQLVSLEGNHDWPAVSPDGEKIAFSSQRYDQASLYIANGDGSDPRPLLGEEHLFTYQLMPEWLDSSTLLFSGNNGESWAIYAVKIDGSGLQKVVEISTARVGSPTVR